jgi:hypothetical protein
VSLQVRDTTPRALAEGLDRLATVLGEQDGEAAAILRRAQRELEALSWNRFAARTSRQCDRRRFIRRHAALLAVRAR